MGFQSGDDLPPEIQKVLKEAMRLENVPDSWYDDLAWICANESGGKVGIPNTKGSSATGLFQLTKGSWASMPHDTASIGNALEEAQGGIRYIKGRYHTAAAAKHWWLTHTNHGHHWY
jgi:hypothetical protein